MDSNTKKWTIVLFSIALAMLLAGCIFVPFVIHVWTFLANLSGEKDAVLACVLMIYTVMFAFAGAAVGLVIDSYGCCCGKWCSGLISKVKALINKKK